MKIIRLDTFEKTRFVKMDGCNSGKAVSPKGKMWIYACDITYRMTRSSKIFEKLVLLSRVCPTVILIHYFAHILERNSSGVILGICTHFVLLASIVALILQCSNEVTDPRIDFVPFTFMIHCFARSSRGHWIQHRRESWQSLLGWLL